MLIITINKSACHFNATYNVPSVTMLMMMGRPFLLMNSMAKVESGASPTNFLSPSSFSSDNVFVAP